LTRGSDNKVECSGEGEEKNEQDREQPGLNMNNQGTKTLTLN